MFSSRIGPRGGLLRRGGGLIRPGGGLLRVPATVAASALPTSIAELYAHSDPAQAIIDLMSYATLPDYLWLGNIADGSWVDVISGLSFTKVGTPTFEAADARFGGADTVDFDAITDGFIDSVNDGTLNIGTGDYQQIVIHAVNANTATDHLLHKFDSVGYRNYANSIGWQFHNVSGASGSATASIAVDHGTTNPLVVLNAKNSSATTIASREGTGTSATATGAVNPSVGLRFCKGAAGALLTNVAVIALWIGTGDLTNTERAALATGLGLE